MRETRAPSFRDAYSRLIARLHRKAEAARWDVSVERFADALERSAERRFCTPATKSGSGRADGPGTALAAAAASEVVTYLDGLHVEDLALACACIDGHEPAWEYFVTRYRPELYGAARATGSDAAREIADTLFADLYGVEVRDGERRSLLEYFHGRSKLSTWLRSVMGQRYVDLVRAARRTEPLEDAGIETMTGAEQPIDDLDPGRERYLALLKRALALALGALDDRSRLRLSCYYVQRLTLAQIGRLTGEHEATVSRKLDKTRRELRQRVDHALETDCGLSREQIAVCYEYAVQDWPFDLERALDAASAQVAGPKSF